MSEPPVLKIALGAQASTNALKDGRVTVPGWSLQFVEHPPNILTAVRNLCRRLEDLDVCEFPLTTYLVARELGLPFTAVPAVIVRQFAQSRIFVNASAGITKPQDLEGKRVGVRAYTVTTAVWGAGMLGDDYGVSSDAITWIAADEEHVKEFVRPANVRAAHGRNLSDMLAAGEIDATNGVPVAASPSVRPLFPDGRAEELAWYRRTGTFCANHTVVVKNSLVKAHPDLPKLLYGALLKARAQGLQDLQTTGPTTDMDRELLSWFPVMGEGILPYGLEANRAALTTLVRYAHEQHALSRRPAQEDLFFDVS